MIPNKIWLKFDEQGLVDESSNEMWDEDYTDFICKDTLLKKLNEIKEYGVTIYGKTSDQLNNFNSGRRDALDSVIGLLNLM